MTVATYQKGQQASWDWIQLSCKYVKVLPDWPDQVLKPNKECQSVMNGDTDKVSDKSLKFI